MSMILLMFLLAENTVPSFVPSSLLGLRVNPPRKATNQHLVTAPKRRYRVAHAWIRPKELEFGKSCRSAPHRPPTPGFLIGSHPATLYTGFCSNDPSFSGILDPTRPAPPFGPGSFGSKAGSLFVSRKLRKMVKVCLMFDKADPTRPAIEKAPPLLLNRLTGGRYKI